MKRETPAADRGRARLPPKAIARFEPQAGQPTTASISCAARVHASAVTVKRGSLASTKHRCVSDEKNGDDRTNGSGLDSNVTRGGAFPTARAFNGTVGQEAVKFSRLREKCTLKHDEIHEPHER